MSKKEGHRKAFQHNLGFFHLFNLTPTLVKRRFINLWLDYPAGEG